MNTMMYKVTTLVLLGLVLVLTSCSIQKRRYRPGFHISINKNYSKGVSSRLIKSKSIEPTDLKSASSDLVIVNTIAEAGAILNKKTNEMNENELTELRENHITIKEVVQEVDRKKMKEHQQMIKAVKAKDTEVKYQADLSKINEPNYGNMTSNQYTKPKQKLSQRHMAIIIGASLLLMALIAGFSATTISNIYVLGNPAQTALNLSANWSGFIGAIIGWIGIFILDVLVSVGVLKYYQKEKARLAIFTGVSRALYTLVLGGAISQLLLVNLSLSSTQIYHLLQAFNQIWGWGLILFGVHLIMLGILYHNEGGKKWFNILIKVLLISAGIGYLLQYTGILLVANPIAFAATVESIFLVSMILGEVLFAFWMLFKGGKSRT